MKIICIGRNYADHIKELNNEVPEEPVIFLKPESSLIRSPLGMQLPTFSSEVHYELEVVVEISRQGKSIARENAGEYYEQLGLGIDLTARDIQKKLKEKGLPWEKSKAFDGSAIVGKFLNKATLPPVDNLQFKLTINDELKQSGNTGMMIHSIDSLISYISIYFTLMPGDLIFTGTPQGVGAITPGEVFEAYLEEEKLLTFNVYQ